jgi:hypothetical protein
MEPLNLLHYRPWRGQLRGAGATVWPIARTALTMIFRRKLFWVLYALALTIFLLFFFGQHLLAWAEKNMSESTVPVGGVSVRTDWLRNQLRNQMQLNGSGQSYHNFFWYQGYMVMAVLALAGSLLVGNDFQFGSLPFYLSKPLGRYHYLLGKGLAVAVLVNLMTTLPAIVLFLQYGLLDSSWDYFMNVHYFANRPELVGPDGGDGGPAGWRLLAGIIGYGLLLTVCLSTLLVATASWLRRTVPMVMVWTTLLLFCRLLAAALVDGLQYNPRWRLIDLWNDMTLLGNACLGIASRGRQPELFEAALVLGATCLLCLSYLNRRIRAVEIVR